MHYDSLLEELVRTHGGVRASEEYDKLKQDKARLIEMLEATAEEVEVCHNGDIRLTNECRKLLQEVSNDNT